MNIRRTFWVVIFIAAAAFALSAWAYPRMPEVVPTHWNAQGQVNGYGSRNVGAFLLPVMMLGVSVLLLIIPEIDPLKANIQKFRGMYNGFIVVFSAFFLYMHVLTTLASLGVALNMTQLMLPGMGLLFIYAGFLLDKAKPNWFIGIRTPWTLSSPTVWEKTHHLGGWMFKIAGAAALVGIFVPRYSFILFFVPTMLSAFVTVIYSYIAFMQEKKQSEKN